MPTAELVAAPAPARADDRLLPRLQRRTIVTLVATQVAGGLGLAAAVTVGGLIAADIGGDAAAGLPLAAAVAGTTAAALPLATVMRRSGRRPGLRLGWLVGAIGATLAVAATSLASLPLLLAGMVLFGAAEAASSAARFAAADLADAARRGAAIGTVVCSTTVTATLGPNLVGVAATAATALRLPPLAGPFLLSTLAFAAAAGVLTVALRPDPLVVAGAMADTSGGGAPAAAPLAVLVARPAVRLGLAAAAAANFTMLLLMTVAPLHLAAGDHHGERLGLIGLIISVHVAGMFAPAPLTGRVGDRIGHARVVAGGAVLLASAGLLTAGAGPHDARRLLVALLLLGVGWNLAFVGGSTLVTAALDLRQRPRVQGLADVAMGMAGMLGAGVSGALMARGGLAAVGALCAAVGVGLCAAAARHRS